MARKIKGTLVWGGKQWSARVPIVVEGFRMKKCWPLGVFGKEQKPLARRKMAKLVADLEGGKVPTADEVTAPETFAEACRRIVASQRAEGLGTWKERLGRLERFALPHVGEFEPSKIRPMHIVEVLEAAREEGMAEQSGHHLRIDLSTVFRRLLRDEAVATNPVAAVKLPGGFAVDKRPRVVLKDDEFARFVASSAVPERLQLMALVSRFVGGMRTSDLHAWDWRHVDTETWDSAEVYRPKTDGEDDGQQFARVELPAEVRAPLFAWWTRWQRPVEGPVFPVMAGGRAGERQGKRSHVRELRRYLWDASVRRPMAGYAEAIRALDAARVELRQLQTKPEGKGRVRAARQAVQLAEAAAKACCQVQSDTPRSRAADFHSFRRAYATGLAAAGLNIQEAMALCGHKDPRTHMKYVELSKLDKAIAAPRGALPRLDRAPVGQLGVSNPAPFSPPVSPGGLFSGDSSENRTRVTGVRGQCPNR